jgi:hypothetical protein
MLKQRRMPVRRQNFATAESHTCLRDSERNSPRLAQPVLGEVRDLRRDSRCGAQIVAHRKRPTVGGDTGQEVRFIPSDKTCGERASRFDEGPD